MKVFSELLLELYRLTQNAPPDEFQLRAMGTMQPVFGFDSAVWATGVVHPGVGVTAHTQFVYRQPPEMMENWARINSHDDLAFEAFGKPGVTINAALCAEPWQSRHTPEVLQHLARFGMAHALTTIVAEPVSQIWAGVSLYRADPRQPFGEEQRLLKQHLMPHLAEAWNISRFAAILAHRQRGIQPGHGQAICDSKGVLYNVDRNFPALLLAEWPGWSGPQLPSPLQEALAGRSPRRYVGQQAVVFFETLNNMELLSAREVSPVDRLGAREHDVAARFANGANYQQIADALCIAPATVRNHLSHVYSKLGVTNKTELARRMRGD